MCGNAIRCVGKYLYDNGTGVKEEMTIETLSGIKTALTLLNTNGEVRLVHGGHGRGGAAARQHPGGLRKGTDGRANPSSVAGEERRITCVSMGNPHCVVFCDPDSLDLVRSGGRRLAHRARSPVPGAGQHRIHHRAGPQHPENAGVGAGQRRDLGLRHRRLRGGGGGGGERVLPRRARRSPSSCGAGIWSSATPVKRSS